ncbi:NosD domain-containing protein [Methanohalophilus halophilus]|uniref:PGF-pre-PGF domain-containing protein n=1 Tax=Methanohalophilus halophilus TaxID=2177 RepID=A0A1L3Q158_9EURY|nr:NosD domain-containing protein [Methanohalophilus halophilus]APH38602.1 hypothetical protein BHR79_03275 [Methanohalophilus halophilus]RNI08399.1 PGF-pre-PGF domain-containing protein [Methanohalophilus halophilus]SDW16549.1 PGF-pre-PGF domain-containing protein [Methanohalophilus halophilus]
MKTPLILLILTILMVGTAGASTINVNETGWWQDGNSFNASSNPIQAAVNNASSGDTISVDAGTYNENVDVNKKLNITSTDGASVTHVIATFSSNPVFKIGSDTVTINGFNVSGANDGDGIRIEDYNHSIIINSMVSNNERGISLINSDNAVLSNNTASGNDYAGIYLQQSDYNDLNDNIVSSNNQYGIYLTSAGGISSNNNFTNNNVSKNDKGIFLQSPRDSTLTDNTVFNNTNNGITLYSGDSYFSENNTLIGNIVSDNSNGIYIDDSDYNNLIDNNVYANTYGIYMDAVDNNNLTNNQVSKNSLQGICLYSSIGNSITSNIVSGNGYTNFGAEAGIYLYGSTDNNIYNNYFNNTENFKTIGQITDNVWNVSKTEGPNIVGGPYIGGNYWRTPGDTGFSQVNTDSDGDGFCDTPNDTYAIHEVQNNYDYLPLAGDSTEPSVDPNTPLNKVVGPGDLLELNVSVTDASEISSVVVDVSSINDTINEVALNNASGYWNNSIIVDTNTDGVYNLSINATDRWGNSNTSMNFSVFRDSFVTVGEGKDYATIQDAVNNTFDGDTIQVFSGTYEENLLIDKGLVIQAVSSDVTVIPASNNSSVFNVTSNDVTIDGFNVNANNTSSSGIFASECDNVTILDNTIYDTSLENFPDSSYSSHEFRANYSLVTLLNCSNTTVSNNILSDGFAGIGVVSGTNLYLTDNEISQVSRGIKSCLGSDYIYYEGPTYEKGHDVWILDNTITNIGDQGIEIKADNVTISGNIINDIRPMNARFSSALDDYNDINGLFGIKVGCRNHEAISCTINDNIISGLYFDENDTVLSDEINHQSGIKLVNATDCLVEDNEISSFEYLNHSTGSFDMQRGIQFSYTENCTIDGNDVNSFYINDSWAYNQVGIHIGYNAYNTSVINNVVSELHLNNTEINRQSGIRISYRGSGNIDGNTVTSLHVINGILNRQDGISLHNSNGYSDGFSVSENTVSDITIDEDSEPDSGNFQAGIAVHNGVNNTILNNDISRVNTSIPTCMYTGLFIGHGDNCTIEANTIEEGLMGLTLKYSNDCNVSGNTIESTAYGGMLVESSYDNLIYDNYFNNENNVIFELPFSAEPKSISSVKENSDNKCKAESNESTETKVNSVGPLMAYENQWNISKTSGTNVVGGDYLGGNYWVHPNGTGFSVDTADSDGDNICDVQYNLSENEIDYLPLAAIPEPEPPKESSSSGGRAYVGPSMPPEDVEGSDSGIKRVLAGSNVKYEFTDGSGPVFGISFDAKDDKGTVVANVQVLKDKPDDVDEPKGNSYQLMSITVGSEGTISDENADNILIEFKVSKEWIEENNIDPSTIRMTRFHNGEWQDLPGNQVEEDDDYFYFTAETPGFSVFSIVGDEYKEVIEEPLAEEPEGEEVADEPAAETEEESAQTPGFTAIFAVALIAGAALIMRKD